MPPNNSTTSTPTTGTGVDVGPGGEVAPVPNGSVVWTDGGVPVQVEQGPRWLVALAFDPPAWVDVGLGLVVLLVLVLVALSLYRNDGLPEGAGREILQNLATVIGAAGITALLVATAPLPYVLDVVGGGLGGGLLGCGLFRWAAASYDRERASNSEVKA